jgi:molybdopterin/thiamine biosynthesis adenylyltransferase
MSWSRHDNDIYVHGESQILLLRACPSETDALMRLLETGCESTALEALDLEASHLAHILDVLRGANCLVYTDSRRWIGTSLERQADYFSALGADPNVVQSTLGSARVTILGVGGIGSVTLAHLVAAGVSRYTLIDGDVVQSDNLNRQLIYSPADVGRLKVEAATGWVMQRSPSAVIRSVPRMLHDSSKLASELADKPSLLVLAADTPSDIALHAAQACLVTGTPLIGADCGLRTASWGPLLEPEDLQAYILALENTRHHAPVPPAAQPMNASFGPTNAIVASYLVKDILSWFAGLPVPSLRAKVTLDMEGLTAKIMSTQDFADALFGTNRAQPFRGSN